MAITVSSITTGSSSIAATSYTTSSITLAANKLALLSVTSRMDSSVSPNIPTVAGWTIVNSIEYDTGAPSQKRISLFRRASTSANTATHTMDFAGQSQTHCDWVLDEFTNTDISGISVGNATYRVGSLSQANITSAGAITVNKAVGQTIGDFVLIVLDIDRSVLNSITWPSGFTQIVATSNSAPDGLNFAMAYKFDTGSEPSTYTITPSDAYSSQVSVTAWKGIDTSSPYTLSTVANSTAYNNPNISMALTGITALTNDVLLLVGAIDNVVSADTWVATTVSTFTNITSYHAISWNQHYIQYKEGLTAGATGTETVITSGGSSNGAGWVGYQLALHAGPDNGESSIVQSAAAKDETLATSALSITLATFGSTNNATYGVFAHGGTVATNTAGSGFTLIDSNIGYHKLTTEFKDTNDTIVDISSDAYDQHGGIALEIKSAPVGGNVTTSISGQSITASRGTISYSSVGNISVGLSGTSGTISLNSLGLARDKVIPNTANVATTSLQTLPTKNITRALTTQLNTISQGSTSANAGSNRTAGLTGISNTLSQGSFTINKTKALTTNLITTSRGSVSAGSGAGTTIALTGTQITASPGTVKATRTKLLTPQSTIIVSNTTLQATGGKNKVIGLFGQSTFTRMGNITPNYVVPKRGTLSIQNDIQGLSPDALVDLFELDTTRYAGGTIYRFHADVNSISTNVVWQGNTYEPFPIEVTGFESSGTGSPARPKVRVANISGYIGALTLSMKDLVGCKFTRKRTFAKYLDAINFTGNFNATADINAHFPNEIFYIDRKSSENNLIVEFELASILDMNGILLPRRDVVRNNCAWKYKSAECGYVGMAAADEFDNLCIAKGGFIPNANDKCGKRFSSCEIRFSGGTTIPFGAFPAVGLVR